MEKEFIPYTEALALKELGFDENSLAWFLPEIADKGNIPSPILSSYSSNFNSYLDRITAPLWQQAFDWFREKCNLFYVIHVHREGYSFNIHTLKKRREDIFLFSTLLSSISSGNYITTYEEAELECLKKLIEIVKSK